MPQFVAESEFASPVENLFRYHARPGALDRLLPPWQNVKIAKRSESIEVGQEVILKLIGPLGLSMKWHAQHTQYQPDTLFEDIQLRGPMHHWTHQHQFHALDGSRSRLCDSVSYQLPLGSAGQWLLGRYFESELKRMFNYRHQVTAADLALIERFPTQPLRIAISGSSGLVGSNLAALLQVAGHQVVRLVRPTNKTVQGTTADSEALVWSPANGLAEPRLAEGLDAVIHLAGKGIGDSRWNAKTKEAIRASRVQATEVLSTQLSHLDVPPKVFVSCSAIGLYGDRGDEILSESSGRGGGFLADVAEGWENATAPLRERGVTRVVHPRLGIVLHPQQAALAKLLLPVRLGLGGRFGSGQQYWSWISIDDCIGSIYHMLLDDRAEGGVNVVSPGALRNREFMAVLAKQLHRPNFLPAPATALKWLLGEMAGPLLLDSCRVAPVKLERLGYSFRHPDLNVALRYLLGL